MKRLLTTALALALGLGFASAQNITKSLQGNANDPRGPVGWDTSNSMYFPNHINAFGNTSTIPTATTTNCGASAAIGTGSTDAAGFVGMGGTGGTSCSVVFGSPFNAAPNCVVSLTVSPAAGTNSGIPGVTTSTTSMQVKGLQTASNSFFYICIGNQ